MNETILLTACINPNTDHQVSINDIETRLKSYQDALLFWIKDSNFKNIVFCENSLYPFDSKKFDDLSDLYNKKFEFISLQGSELGKERGKGFLEGEMMEFALKNSKLLKSSESFYKVTGRLIIKNVNTLLKLHKNDPSVFLLAARKSTTIDTRFFKCSKEAFIHLLGNSYKSVFDKNGYYLEHSYFDTIRNKNIQIKPFKLYPDIIGLSGSTGTTYQKSFIGRILRTLLIKLGQYSI